MNENVISLISKLASSFLNEGDYKKTNREKRNFKCNLKKLSRTAFSIIQQTVKEDTENSYNVGGVEWYPEILITDYGYELMNKGATCGSNLLFSSLHQLNQKKFDCIDDIWKLLLNLKGPYNEKEIEKHPFSLSGKDYFLRSQNSFELLPADFIGSGISENESRNLETKKDEDNVFLNLFLEAKKPNVETPKLSLDDYINEEPPVPFSRKKKNKNVETFPTVYVNKPPAPQRCISPWSDVEMDILDGKEFSDEQQNLSFVENYETVLHTEQPGIFSLQHKHRDCKPSDVVLGIFLEDDVMRQLIDPSHKIVVPREILLNDYVSQVKYLLCGVDSGIFSYDDKEEKFYMKIGIYVKGLSPTTLFEISQTYLRTGTLFRKLTLQVECHLNDSNCGILYPAFWERVKNFLLTHSDTVTTISPNCTIIELERLTADLHAKMAAVYKLCVETKNATTGGLLLNYLYFACNAAQQDCVRKVIMSFLYYCCTIYFIKHVQKWAFQGCLDNKWAADLFVGINLELSCRRDRVCYSSVSIEEALVPNFLKMLAPKIFSCGKSIWLLKLFDPENTFIHYLDAGKYPKMEICMKEEEIWKLEDTFSKYQEDIVKLCGPEISFKTILQKNEDEDKDKKEYYAGASREGDLKKIKEALTKSEEKKRLYQEQLEAATAEKNRKLQMIKEEKANDEIRNQNLLDKEKELILEKYKLLTSDIEKVKMLQEWQSKRFDLNNKRMQLLSEDFVNKNTILDEEGNLILNDVDEADGKVIIKSAPTEAEKIKQKIMKSQFTLGVSATKMITDDSPVSPVKTMSVFESASPMGQINETAEKDNNSNFPIDCVVGSMVEEEIALDIINRNNSATNETDLINRNEELSNQNPKITDAMRNKLKVLGTEFKIINEEVTADEKTKINAQTKMTDAMKNKLKVLGTEFGIPIENNMKNTIFDCKQESTRPQITEAMKNKLRVLGTEYSLNVNEKNYITESKISENCKIINVTELMKNKQQTLGSDFDIATPVLDEVDGVRSTSGIHEMPEGPRNAINELGTEIDLIPAISNNEEKVKTNFEDKLDNLELSPKSESDLNKQTEMVKKSDESSVETHMKNVSAQKYINSTKVESSILSQIVESSDCTNLDADILTFTRNLQRCVRIAIDTQENLANSIIIKHFLLKENFVAHITSIRCYFLLYDGEFSRSLTYGLFQALTHSLEPCQIFDRTLLSNILNEALLYTGVDAQINANNLSFQILKMPKVLNIDSHDVFSPFQLTYKVKWPLNIIITDPAIDRYRKVFHLLVNLKRVHWILNEAFSLLKAQTKDSSLDGTKLMKSPEYTKLATYRYAMTLYIITLEEYISGYGLLVAWNDFMKNLESVSNLDELYQKHVAFVKDLCRRCFLAKASQDLLSYIHELIELGLKFYSILKSGKWHQINETHYSHPKYTALRNVFNQFCKTTKIFNKTLDKKTTYPEMKIHLPLLELIKLKIIV